MMEDLSELWRLFEQNKQLTDTQVRLLYSQAHAGLAYLRSRGMLFGLAKSRTEEDHNTLVAMMRIRGLLKDS